MFVLTPLSHFEMELRPPKREVKAAESMSNFKQAENRPLQITSWLPSYSLP